MKNSQLFHVFSSLDKQDFRELKKWVHSRAFNKRADVIHLFEYLTKIGNKKDKWLQKEFIFQRLFPGQPFDDEKIRVTQFHLLKVIKSFLVYQEAVADPTNWQIHLCKAYSKKGLRTLFEKEWQRTMTWQSQQPFRNFDFHYHNFQLHQEYVNLTLRNQRSDAIDMGRTMRELKVYYLAETLRLSCAMLSQQQLTQKDYDLKEVTEVVQSIEEGDYLQLPAIALYYHGYQLLSKGSDAASFPVFKKTLQNHWHQFPPKECRDLYLLAINYCIRQLNQGRQQYIREAFDLYQNGLEQSVLLEDGQLSKFTYNNVLTLAIGLNEWDWAAAFLETYKVYLPEKERQNIYEYNLAIYYFRKPDYHQAMQLLRQVEFKDVLYNLNSRSMLARIYFELDEMDALDSLLDSFNVYLRRQKQLSYHKENYGNFIAFLRKMLRSNLAEGAIKRRLAEELKDTTAIAEKQWLLEQLA